MVSGQGSIAKMKTFFPLAMSFFLVQYFPLIILLSHLGSSSDVCPSVQQQLYNLIMPVTRCSEERCGTVLYRGGGRVRRGRWGGGGLEVVGEGGVGGCVRACVQMCS